MTKNIKSNLTSKVTKSKFKSKSWKDISWKQVNLRISKLRYLIFKAKKKNNIKLTRRLQKLMLRSDANIIWSIRRVTSINVGKRTPGLDKMLIKTNEEKWKLFKELSQVPINQWASLSSPVKRIYIPKANGKMRPLGIPTIKTRILQSIVKNALEPEWEAVFESSSYGFRPGRSCHDALSRVYNTVAGHKKRLWVLDADIKGCFDNIDHNFLIETIGDFPAKEAIKAWLKVGYCEFPDTEMNISPSGTPQGGIISPLLANITLHGIEKILNIKTVSTTGHNASGNKYAYVRYADDFLVFSDTKENCIEAKNILNKWLKSRNLKFSSEKITITHLKSGIEFLGCQIKLYGQKKPTFLIKPHPKKIQAFKNKLKEIWLHYKGTAPKWLILRLNPVIRAWANYYSPFCSSEVFSDLDHFMWHRAWRFSKRRHPNKNHYWIAHRYFGQQTGPSKDKWRWFSSIKGKGKDKDKGSKLFLLKFQDFKISRHVLVKNNMVPDDRSLESLAYWEKRLANKQYKKWSNQENKLKIAKKQYHICPICESSLYDDDQELHVHHIKAKKNGGTDSYGNLIILHEICHRAIHSRKLNEQEVRNLIKTHRKKIEQKIIDNKSFLSFNSTQLL